MKEVAAIGGSKAWNMNPHNTDPQRVHQVLPPQTKENEGKPTLLLDIDETLLHCTFKPEAGVNYDFDAWCDIDGKMHHVYGLIRPGLSEFLATASKRWELVAFTASIAKYANAVMDYVDPDALCFWRLFRDSCVPMVCGNKKVFIKDLAIVGRSRTRTLLLDNSPNCYLYQPEQGIPIESWFEDKNDDQLLKILPVLDRIADEFDIIKGLRNVLPWYEGGKEGCSQPLSDPYDGVDWDGLPKFKS
jgi:carboxy-terminal domain RNA polymerase II polypeptide A small phosphatase